MRGRRLRLLARLVIAAVAGIGLGIAFPPYDLHWLTVVAVAGLVLALRGGSVKAGFALGTAFGVGFFGVLLPWIRVIGVDAMIALSVIEALYFGFFGALAVLAMRTRGWLITVPALWVLTELVQGNVPFGGFPWGRLGWAVLDTSVSRYAALLGVSGVSFIVALLGTLLAYGVVVTRRPKPDAVGQQAAGPVRGADRGRWLPGSTTRRAAAFVMIAIVMGAGFLIPLPPGGERSVPVAIVQGNVPGEGLDFLGERRAVTNNHVAATLRLADQIRSGAVPRPQVVIWPENSTDIDPFTDPATRAAIEQAVRAVGVPILVGAVLDRPGPGYRQTAGVVWDPVTGPGKVYAKQHPVPFGEYIPMRRLLLRYIDRLQMVGKQTYPGQLPGDLAIAGVTYGDVICFEIAYDDVVGEVINRGAQILVVQTNNATYADTGQPLQQFAITRLRAIETGRTTLVASTNGISGVILANGQVAWQSAAHAQVVHVASVAISNRVTLAVRLGAVPNWVLGVLALLGALLGAMVTVRDRRQLTAQRDRPGGIDGTDETDETNETNETDETDETDPSRPAGEQAPVGIVRAGAPDQEPGR